MESKNFCVSEDLPFGTIQSRSAYSRSNAGWRPSSARSLMATPPRSLRVAPSRSASSVMRLASSTTSDRVPLILSPPLSLYSVSSPAFLPVRDRVPSRPSPGVGIAGPDADGTWRPHPTFSLPGPAVGTGQRGSTSLLSCFLGGLHPGLDDVLVILQPVAHALLGAVGASLVDLRLYRVDLLFVERDRLEESVGLRVVIGEILVHHGEDLGRVVEGSLEVLRVVEVVEVVLGVHPVRRPSEEHDGLLSLVGLVELGEHSRRAGLDELHVQVVPGDHLVLDHGVEGRARLDARYLVRPCLIEVRDALHVHVVRDGDTVGGLALVPRVQKFHVVLDLGVLKTVLVVRKPDILERLEVTAGDALEQRAELEGALDLDLFVAQVILHDDLRKGRDGDVLIPPDAPQGKGLAPGGASPSAPAARQHECCDRDG